MITINLKGLLGIWKEPRQPLSWRHGVIFLLWLLTIIPAIVLVVFSVISGACSEFIDASYGKVKRWANPKAYEPYYIPWDRLPAPKLDPQWPDEGFNIRDYLNADRDSITQPFQDSMLRDPPTR